MKTIKKVRYLSLLLTLLLVVMMAVSTVSMAAQAQPTVNLGTTSSFAVLAGSAITNTGTTTINGDAGGDVGLYPGTAFDGKTSVTVSGAVHLADDAAMKAKDDLVTAYNDAAGRVPVTTIPTELGGSTLTPGTYASADGTFQITGTLTLDAQGDPEGVFVFKTASTLITASSSNVNLINSARYCRTFWQVGSSATLGTNSHFVGHIFALASITATTGATVQGQLLARNGAVTLDTNTITNGICATTPVTPPLINVIKTPIPLALTSGQGSVTYTYKVNNPGTVALSNVSVTDDKVSAVNYVSGDVNADNLLQPNETWIYTSKMILNATTTNTATAKGSANGITATGIASATVVVTAPVVVKPTVPGGKVVATTVTGGQLPKTSTPWYNVLLAGAVLTLIGAAGWITRKIYV
jgi:uncharacterized repeat protein (TIGR01451 family)/LPXTG-motif cell wall-anchored protein